ncbi:hypothetical protein IPH25_01565 [bacterium]|nr:MAG: hypothetical protein IPG37_03695 [bacterium]QQR62114.1 MAG: hypothetical protein IPH25_01565 [bacterium]QQR63327.1 MAG: hypothetical protein IPH67_02545 [bacterium]
MKKLLYVCTLNLIGQIDAMNNIQNRNGYLALEASMEHVSGTIINAINKTSESLESTQIDTKTVSTAMETYKGHAIYRNEEKLEQLASIIIPDYELICVVGATCKEFNKKHACLIKPIKAWYKKINAERNNVLLAIVGNIVNEAANSNAVDADMSHLTIVSSDSITDSDMFKKSKIYVHETEHKLSIFQYPSLEDQARILVEQSRPCFKPVYNERKSRYSDTLDPIKSPFGKLFLTMLRSDRLVNKELKNVFTQEDNTWLENLDYMLEIYFGQNTDETISILKKKLLR